MSCINIVNYHTGNKYNEIIFYIVILNYTEYNRMIYISNHFVVFHFSCFTSHQLSSAQDYEVGDIECSFGRVGVEKNRKTNERLTARLRKPEGFEGTPIFADDRKVDPLRDPECQIRPDIADKDGLIYRLLITDLDKCGVLIKNVSETLLHVIYL